MIQFLRPKAEQRLKPPSQTVSIVRESVPPKGTLIPALLFQENSNSDPRAAHIEEVVRARQHDCVAVFAQAITHDKQMAYEENKKLANLNQKFRCNRHRIGISYRRTAVMGYLNHPSGDPLLATA